jgi:hypothetical protein
MNIHRLIMYLAGIGVVYCLIMAVTSSTKRTVKANDIKNYECTPEQYGEVNYKTNRCMMEDYLLHETCFYNAVTSMCARKGSY